MRRLFTAQTLRFVRIAAVAMFLFGGPGAARSALAHDLSAPDSEGKNLPNWEDGPQHHQPQGHQPKGHRSAQPLEAPRGATSQNRPNWEDGPQILGRLIEARGDRQGSSRHSGIPVLVLSPLTISVTR